MIVHAGFNDIQREQSELLKRDYTDLFDTLDKIHIKSFISGPIPAVDRGINRFSRLLGLNTWLSRVCNERGRGFIDNFNLFWGRKYLFRADGLHPNRLGSKLLRDNLLFSLSHNLHGLTHRPQSEHRLRRKETTASPTHLICHYLTHR